MTKKCILLHKIYLSLRVFRLLSSSLLSFPQRFGRYVLWSYSGVCRTWEPSQNLELRPLLNLQKSPVLIPLAITGYKCELFLLWLTESEQATPVDSIKDVVQSSVKVPEFNKHLNKTRGHIGQNVEMTIKMKKIVQKP